MSRQAMPRWRHLLILWVAGSFGLALVTAVCFWLNISLGATGFLFLIVIVLLSLMDSLISSLIFSIVAVASLDFFFSEPRFSFEIADFQDVWRLAAFFVTSLVITHLVRRQHRAAVMQSRQARLLDLTHDAIFVFGMDDAIVYWNRGAEALYGWTQAEALGRSPYDLLQTGFPVPLPDIKAELGRSGRWDGELVHTRRDGSTVHVASRWSMPRDEAGQPIGILETNSDISERKRAEDALRRSQAAYLAEAQQLSKTGSFGWDTANGELSWSEETFRIFGYEPTATASLDLVRQRVHPDDAQRVSEVIERAARDRQKIDFELRLLMPDGSVKTLHVVAHPINGEADTGPFVGAVMDVTARSEAYAALELSEQRYRRLFQNMPISLWQLDSRGLIEIFRGLHAAGVTDVAAYMDAHPEFVTRVLDVLIAEEVNDVTVEMFGVQDRRELLGPTTRFWRTRPDTIRRAMESQFRGEPAYEERTQVDAPDGRVIDVLLSAARIGLGTTLVGLVDLTDLVRTQEKLEQLQAEFAHAARLSVLGELTASIAHEVNQPLAALATNGETGLRWLGRPEPNVGEALVTLRNIVADARRASQIIARIQGMAARRAPQRVLLSLHDVIDEALLFLRHELQGKSVSVSLNLAPALPAVLGDRTQLQQVIVNLAINAVQAMTQAGTPRRILVVRTAPSAAGKLSCMLDDSGPGIAPEHLDHLFDSFFTTKETGMGMGLAISRSIIEGHGGKLWAENGSEHGGARFSFTLPTAPDPDSKAARVTVP